MEGERVPRRARGVQSVRGRRRRSRRRSRSRSEGPAQEGGRVAAIRELYANGDADGALAPGALEPAPPPAHAGYDSPDSTVSVEVGEESIDLEDLFRSPNAEEAPPALLAPTAPPP